MSCQILLIFIKSIFFVPLRIAYLGLTLSLRTISFIICIPGFILLSRQLKEEERSAIHGALRNGGTELEVLRKEELVISNSDQPHHPSENSTDRQTRLWQSQQSWRPHIYQTVCLSHENKICRESLVVQSSHVKQKFYICTAGCVKAL